MIAALIKYFASICFFFATFVMFDATIAATSALPWVSFLLGNTVWVFDSYKSNNKPWVMIGIVFIVLDLLLICDRLYHLNLVHYVEPVLRTIEKLT